MRKIIYVITGFLTSLILFVFLFIDIPEVERVKTDPSDFKIDQNLQFTNLRDVPSNHSTIFAGGTYHLSQAQIDAYENVEVVKYGKYNPMFMYKHETAPPVEEQTSEDGTVNPANPTNPAEGDDTSGGSFIPDDVETLKGFNVKTESFEEVNVVNALFDFQNTGRIPVDMKYNYLSSKFGVREDPFEKVQAFHSGIDYSAPEIDGANVYSVSHGEVLEVVKGETGYGNYVLVQHNGYQSLYGHLSAFGNVKVGDKVKAGAVLGKVGTTGRSTGPHLHFEIRINDVAVDPLVFINQLGKGE